MRYIPITLAGVLSILPLVSEAQQQPSCGDPPRVDDRLLKTDLEGKAKFLSSLVGEAGLKGQIATARADIFSKYPNADRTRSDAYMEYMLCSFVLSDPNLSAPEKFRAIQEFRQSASLASEPRQISTQGAQSPAVESKGDTNIGYAAAPPPSAPGNAPPAPASSPPPAADTISTQGSQSPAVKSEGNVGIQYGPAPTAAPVASGSR